MKVLNLICCLFAFNLFQATNPMDETIPGTSSTTPHQEIETYDFLSKLVDPIRVQYLTVTDIEFKEVNLSDFIADLRSKQNMGEDLLNTAIRVIRGLLLFRDQRQLEVIVAHNSCTRPLQLNTLLKSQTCKTSAEILGNSLLKIINHHELNRYSLNLALQNQESQDVTLTDLINLIRNPVTRDTIRGIELDPNAFTDLRCDYSIEGEIVCSPLADLLTNKHLLARLGMFDHLYITRYDGHDASKYLAIRPAGEFVSVGVNSKKRHEGSMNTVKVNIITQGRIHGFVSLSNDDDREFFDNVLDALKTEYSVEFFRAHRINISDFMKTHKLQLISMSETKGASIIGPSAGAAWFVAACSAITGQKVNPDFACTGTMRPDGSVGPVGSTPAKAKIAFDNGYKVFGSPKLSIEKQFGKGWFFCATVGYYPQLEPGNGLVRKVVNRNCEVHVIRGVADLLKLAFGFESKLDPNKQRMSIRVLFDHLRQSGLRNALQSDKVKDFLYERGYFTKEIENNEEIEIKLCGKRRKIL